MIRPRYQDIAPERIPESTIDGARTRVVAGNAFGMTGPVTGIDVEPIFVDVTVTRGVRFTTPLPAGHNAFVYVTDGAVRLGPPSTSPARSGAGSSRSSDATATASPRRAMRSRGACSSSPGGL